MVDLFFISGLWTLQVLVYSSVKNEFNSKLSMLSNTDSFLNV